MQDLHQVFTVGAGPITLAHELALYRNYGVSLHDLPQDKRITLWHGLSDNIVPPAMACKMALALPNCEAHLVAGGHFVAIDIAGRSSPGSSNCSTNRRRSKQTRGANSNELQGKRPFLGPRRVLPAISAELSGCALRVSRVDVSRA